MQSVREQKKAVASAAVYKDEPWFKIDNAATLYAAARTKKWCRTYRAGLVLDHEIDRELLQTALEQTAKRLPTFCVKLRDGMFWSYFERTDAVVQLCEDTKYPYRPIQLEGTDQPCFRILYYKNRVVIEAFHSLSDGGGSDVFFATLIGRYFELRGVTVEKSNRLLDVNDAPKQAEARDSYYEYYDPSVSAKNPKKVEVFLGENNTINNFSQLIHGFFKVDEVKAAAKKRNLTITEYLVAVLIFMFYSCEDKPIDKPISICVPIDLRKRFPSDSVRNFVFMTDVSYNPEGRTDVTFEEICEEIRGKLAAKASKENLQAAISSNVSAASSKLLRPIPYVLKKAFLKNTYRDVQQSYSMYFSNLGVYEYPPEISRHILRAETCLGDSPYLHFGCASATVNGLLTFTFSSGNRDTKRQRFFFRFLANDGIRVRIESNVHE